MELGLDAFFFDGRVFVSLLNACVSSSWIHLILQSVGMGCDNKLLSAKFSLVDMALSSVLM